MDGEAGERGKKLNWRQACEILGCGRNRFYDMVRQGHLPAYRLAGAKRKLWVYEDDCLSLAKKIDVPLTESPEMNT